MSKNRNIIVLNGVKIKYKGNKIYAKKNLSYPHQFEYVPIHGNIVIKDSDYYNYIYGDSLRVIYNTKTKKRIYFSPTEHTIKEYVRAVKEAEAHEWPYLGIIMNPMGFKCNYWEKGFRVQVVKNKKWYNVRIYKNSSLEKSYRARIKTFSYKIDSLDKLKDTIIGCKIELL